VRFRRRNPRGLYSAGHEIASAALLQPALIRTDVAQSCQTLRPALCAHSPFPSPIRPTPAQVSLTVCSYTTVSSPLPQRKSKCCAHGTRPDTLYLSRQVPRGFISSAVLEKPSMLGFRVALGGGPKLLAISRTQRLSVDHQFPSSAAECGSRAVEVAQSSTPLYFSPPSPGCDQTWARAVAQSPALPDFP